MVRSDRIKRVAVGLVVLAVVLALAWWLFLVVLVLGARIARRAADRVAPGYNAAEVAVEGPITRDGSGVLPATPGGTPADDVVDAIERADGSGAAALLVKLNTPGGEVVPSDDIRRAARAFDGPTIAYATDVCASGGYWIASGCDEVWARDASLVGSIGVIMSQVNAAELAEGVGLTYEGFTAGEYKDAGVPLEALTDDERAYFQGLTDDFYEQFVERVAEGRDLDPEAVRETEARVYLGADARDRGLVDALGAREDVEEHLEDELGEPVTIREFEPEAGLTGRLRRGAQATAYAFGAGVAGAVVGDREQSFRFR